MVREEVGPDDVAEVVAAWTGIPAGRLLEGETAKLLRMEEEIGHRVVGQAEAVRAVADALGLNLRTLQRQLDTQGCSFSELLSRVRRQQLPRHFANPRLRLTDIADLLGYASLGAFTRWHIDQYGETPSQARRRR